MRKLKPFVLLFIFACYSFSWQSNIGVNETKDLSFHLLNVDGRYVSISDYKDAKGLIIIFTCNHCPFAKLYPARLNKLNQQYKKLGVPLIAISSTDSVQYEEDDFQHMVVKAKKENFNYPYLYDRNQQVAKNYKAQKTPHAFVIWKEKNQWLIKYSGAIDDNGMNPKEVKTPYVENAVNALLKGENTFESETKSIGCQIYFRN